MVVVLLLLLRLLLLGMTGCSILSCQKLCQLWLEQPAHWLPEASTPCSSCSCSNSSSRSTKALIVP